MLKRITSLAVVVTLSLTNVSGVALASNNNARQNHASYWETNLTSCMKLDDFSGSAKRFSTNKENVVKVIVKGGPDRAVYASAPFTNLTAPVNPNNKHNKTYGISHAIVCFGQVESETNNSNDESETNHDNENQSHNNNNDHNTDSDKPENKPARNNRDNSHTPVTICHRTRSVKNPYVMITVDDDAADGLVGHGSHKADHYGVHTGDVFSSDTDYAPNAKNWGDIIPPVAGAHSGLNWDAEGRAIYANDCQPLVQQADQPDEEDDNGEVLDDTSDETTDKTTDEQGEILDAASTTRQVAGAQAPARLANTGVNALLAFLVPAIAAVMAYPLLRSNKES